MVLVSVPVTLAYSARPLHLHPGAPISTSFQFDIIPGNSPGETILRGSRGREELLLPSPLSPPRIGFNPRKITGQIRFDNSITIISSWTNSWSASSQPEVYSSSSFHFFLLLFCRVIRGKGWKGIVELERTRYWKGFYIFIHERVLC